jgi:hypothetical protein
MALKSFIINNSNKFFAKTHDYKELQAWMEKTSDKFYASFVFSWILAGVSFSIEYFIFKKDVLSNISGFWILFILGLFLFVLSGVFIYYKDFVKRIEPTILKKSEIFTWKEAYPNQKDIDVWIEVFTSMFDSSLVTLTSYIKVGENCLCEEDTDERNFLLHILNSYSANQEMQNPVSIYFEKDVNGEKTIIPFEFGDKVKYNKHLEARYKINVDETLETLKETMRLDSTYFGQIREEILSNSSISISKLEVGRQLIDYNVYGHNFQDVNYVIRVTIDVKANEELQNSEMVKSITTSAEAGYQQKQDVEKAKEDMLEFKTSLL